MEESTLYSKISMLLALPTLPNQVKPHNRDYEAYERQYSRMMDRQWVTSLDLFAFADAVASRGLVFCGSYMSGREEPGESRSLRFLNQVLFGLDVDQPTMSLEDFIAKSVEAGFPPYFAHYTQSSTKEQPRYRVVYRFDVAQFGNTSAKLHKTRGTKLKVYTRYETLQLAAKAAIEPLERYGVDIQCSDPVRVWQGGFTGLMYYDDTATIDRYPTF